MVHGSSPDVGRAIVEHPATRAVGFTGSHAVGRKIFDLAAARARPIPVYAEMGSVNPVIVLPGALSERGSSIVEGLATSGTLGVGQFCTNPGLVFLCDGGDSPASDAFVEKLAKEMAGTKGFMLTSAIRERCARAFAPSE